MLRMSKRKQKQKTSQPHFCTAQPSGDTWSRQYFEPCHLNRTLPSYCSTGDKTSPQVSSLVVAVIILEKCAEIRKHFEVT